MNRIEKLRYAFNNDTRQGWMIRNRGDDTYYVDLARPQSCPISKHAWTNYTWPTIAQMKLLGAEVEVPDEVIPK